MNNHYCIAWTEQAIDCYKRGCECEGCYIRNIMENRCDMKRAVFELVRKFGAPKNELGLTKTELKIVKAILDGANTKEEIGFMCGTTEDSVQYALCNLYQMAEADGFIFRNVKNKLPDFIVWVRQGGLNP